MQGVEQFANKEASGHRFVAWVIGHFGWSYDRDIQPIDLTGVKYTNHPLCRQPGDLCCRASLHVEELMSRICVSFSPLRHLFRH